MATVTLTWTPAGGSNSINQKIYRGLNISVSTLLSTVAPNIATYTDTTAPDGVTVYYRIDNICTNGGPTASTVVSITTQSGGEGGGEGGGGGDPVEYQNVGWGSNTSAACSMAVGGEQVLYTTCALEAFGAGCQLYLDGSMSQPLQGFTHLFANNMNWLITTEGTVIGLDDIQC